MFVGLVGMVSVVTAVLDWVFGVGFGVFRLVGAAG